jgi:hypothetical protein
MDDVKKALNLSPEEEIEFMQQQQMLFQNLKISLDIAALR